MDYVIRPLSLMLNACVLLVQVPLVLSDMLPGGIEEWFQGVMQAAHHPEDSQDDDQEELVEVRRARDKIHNTHRQSIQDPRWLQTIDA